MGIHLEFVEFRKLGFHLLFDLSEEATHGNKLSKFVEKELAATTTTMILA